ncbi:hypothetical protein HMPREF3197_04184 [Klebsiella pneumoniae]|nr:hypothetical protein HMPREF3197_04184 [Klebsiella pneumoniae]
MYDSQRIPCVEVAAHQQSVVTIQLTFLGYENVNILSNILIISNKTF